MSQLLTLSFFLLIFLLVSFSCCSSVSAQYTVRRIIYTDKAPESTRLSQAVQVDNMLYVSGTLGITVEDGAFLDGIQNQTRQALDNIGYILDAAGSSYLQVVKTTILLSNMSDVGAVNPIYEQYFTDKFPARAAYQVAALPSNALIEIEAIAIVGEVVDV